MHSRFDKQLKIGRTDLDELPNAESVENYFAYHLGNFSKENSFLFFSVFYLKGFIY